MARTIDDFDDWRQGGPPPDGLTDQEAEDELAALLTADGSNLFGWHPADDLTGQRTTPDRRFKAPEPPSDRLTWTEEYELATGQASEETRAKAAALAVAEDVRAIFAPTKQRRRHRAERRR